MAKRGPRDLEKSKRERASTPLSRAKSIAAASTFKLHEELFMGVAETND
jgi:hypothetical protein